MRGEIIQRSAGRFLDCRCPRVRLYNSRARLRKPAISGTSRPLGRGNERIAANALEFDALPAPKKALSASGRRGIFAKSVARKPRSETRRGFGRHDAYCAIAIIAAVKIARTFPAIALLFALKPTRTYGTCTIYCAYEVICKERSFRRESRNYSFHNTNN